MVVLSGTNYLNETDEKAAVPRSVRTCDKNYLEACWTSVAAQKEKHTDAKSIKPLDHCIDAARN